MTDMASDKSVTALLVGDFGADRLLVHDVFRGAKWRLLEAPARKSAMKRLAAELVHVVIADGDIPGWGWCSVFSDLRQFHPAPQLIVASRVADERLWSEVLNRGAYDVLARPLDRDEVERVVASARRHFDFQPERAAAGAA